MTALRSRFSSLDGGDVRRVNRPFEVRDHRLHPLVDRRRLRAPPRAVKGSTGAAIRRPAGRLTSRSSLALYYAHNEHIKVRRKAGLRRTSGLSYNEHYRVKRPHSAGAADARRTARGQVTPGAQARQPHPRRRALAQDLAAEAEQLGRPAAGLDVELAGAFDQAAVLDQAAEVLLVQPNAGQGLDDALELERA